MSSQVPAWLITVERVHALHDYAIATWGGAVGIRELGCVEGRIGSAASAGFYAMDTDDHEPDVLTVAAHLLYYFARNQCYADGNKRVAWLAFTDQIAVLGLDVDAKAAEVEAFVLDIAAGEIESCDAVLAWVAPRLIAFESV